jgi:hypothetical protein
MKIFYWFLIFLIICECYGNEKEIISMISESEAFFPASIFVPSTVENFRTKENRTIPIHFNSNHTFEGNILFKCEDSYYCEVIVPKNETFIQLSKENNYSVTIDVIVLAKFVGFNELEVVMNDTVIFQHRLRILRSSTEHILAKVFTAVTAIFIFFVTFLMGTQLSIDCIWQIMKRPVGPLTGFFCQFGVMPLVAYGLAKTILPSEDKALQFSLFAAGCSPGGGKSSFWTIIFNGNLDLSVSMTLTQTIGAMGKGI